jgi:hypothetical protein
MSHAMCVHPKNQYHWRLASRLGRPARRSALAGPCAVALLPRQGSSTSDSPLGLVAQLAHWNVSSMALATP